MNHMKQLGVCKLEKIPPNRKHISTLWVFCEKRNEIGQLVRSKARWIVIEFMQAHGIEYDLVHAHVSKMTTLRVLFSLAARQNLRVQQMDFTTAFLISTLEESIYEQPPPGY